MSSAAAAIRFGLVPSCSLVPGELAPAANGKRSGGLEHALTRAGLQALSI